MSDRATRGKPLVRNPSGGAKLKNQVYGENDKDAALRTANWGGKGQ